jgi:hypothetical protein
MPNNNNNNNNNNNGANMNASYFPELDHALADLDEAKAYYASAVNKIGNYGNEGAAKDAINDEFDSKLDDIKTKVDEMLGAMRGGRRKPKSRKGKSRKQRKSRKASRKARKTRRR